MNMEQKQKAREILEYLCSADARNANPHAKDIADVMTATQAMRVCHIAEEGGN